MKGNEPGPWTKRRKNATTAAILALLAVAAIVGSGGLLLLSPHSENGTHWATVSENPGPNPVSQQLEIQFARVAYIDQPTEFNTTGFHNASLVYNSSWSSNSSGYGILQYNSTVGDNALANYAISGYLGSNVSYLFANQRFGLNGSETIFTFGAFEAKPTTAPSTSGNVTNANAGSTQNAVWLVATHASDGNYTLKVGDWEEKNGGYQTLTLTAFSSSIQIMPLRFYDVLLYVQSTKTVVTVCYTNNETALGSVTVHPVVDGNLSKIAYLSDSLFQATNGVNGAFVVDTTYAVDHNAWANSPAAQGAVVPALAGAIAPRDAVAPFDPSTTALTNATQEPASAKSWSSVKVSPADFSSVENSSTLPSEGSSMINASQVVNRSKGSNVTDVYPAAALATIRTTPEKANLVTPAELVVNSWDPTSFHTQVLGYLRNYIGTQTGIPSSNIVITGYTIEKISVVSTFTKQAAKTVHDYLVSAIPGFLASSHLALVDPATGAVQAGADLGMFLGPDGVGYKPQVDLTRGTIYDPVNGLTYANTQAAGFPIGTQISAEGAIEVPGQATFLGWSATGQLEVSGCFIVCTSSLTGAADAVSNFLGSASTDVSNAASTVSSTASTAASSVIQPVTTAGATAASDWTSFAGNVAGAVSQALPVFGATVGDVSSAVSTGLTSAASTLGSVGSAMASTASGAAGALSAGVDSFTNGVASFGAGVGSAIADAPPAIAAAGNYIVNTAGQAVNDASAMISPVFSSVANLAGGAGTYLANATKSMASLGTNVLSAGMNALDGVGTSITQAISGAYNWAKTTFGGFAGGILKVFGIGDGNGTPAWPNGPGIPTTLILVIVVVAIILVIGVIAAIWLIHRRNKRRHGSSGTARKARGRHAA